MPRKSRSSAGSRTANEIADGLGQQAPADELQDLGGGDVEPLGVVDQPHHRSP